MQSVCGSIKPASYYCRFGTNCLLLAICILDQRCWAGRAGLCVLQYTLHLGLPCNSYGV